MSDPNTFKPAQDPPKISPTDHDRLLTVKQAMARLACCRATFYALLNTGQLTAVKIRNATRVRESDLLAFIDGLPTVQKSEATEAHHG